MINYWRSTVVLTKAERTEKQSELNEEQMKSQQRIQEKQKKVEELKQTVNTIKSFQSLCVSSGHEDSPSITVNQHLSFDGVRKSLSDLKNILKKLCHEEFITIHKHDERNCPAGKSLLSLQHVAAVQMILPPEPKSREDFLHYYCDLTLDPNTVHNNLILSENNRAVTFSERKQQYSDHPERFDSLFQALCKENVCGRCYWEVEWSGEGGVDISVSYKEISRKGLGNECAFGRTDQSWSLWCAPSSLTFCHNNIKTDLSGPLSSRIGVYVDHSAGTLSFYSVSDTMKLLHRVQTTFTQPLYAGFWIGDSSTVRLRRPK